MGKLSRSAIQAACGMPAVAVPATTSNANFFSLMSVKKALMMIVRFRGRNNQPIITINR